ncbi:MAG: hypothetical protein PHE77_00590 [Candidatus Pacebacteria bacterium]|nr:hypothetical protein [Candidatus Paceibacterota bacterium]
MDLKKVIEDFDAKIELVEEQEGQTTEQKMQLFREKANAVRQVYRAEAKKAEEKGETALKLYYYCRGEMHAFKILGKSKEELPFYNQFPRRYGENCDCPECRSLKAFINDYGTYSSIFLSAMGALLREISIFSYRDFVEEPDEASLRARLYQAGLGKIIEGLEEAREYITGGNSILEVMSKAKSLNCAHQIIIRAYREDKTLLKILLPTKYIGFFNKLEDAEKIKMRLQELKVMAEKAQSLVDVSEILMEIEKIKTEEIPHNPYIVYSAGVTDEDLEAPKKILAEKTKL